MAYTEQEARQLVVEAGHRLLEKGLVARTWGNISARVSDSHFVITPSGMGYDTMTPDQLVLVNGRDLSYQGPRKPSSEKGIHADAYLLRQSVNFVIHTHQDAASVCGIAGRDLVTDHPLLGGRVPCAPYGLPSTKKLRRAAAKQVAAYPESNAILLRSHGALCLGQDMEHAFSVSAALEDICAIKLDTVLAQPTLPDHLPDLGESQRSGAAFSLTAAGETRTFSLEEESLPFPASLHAVLYRNDETVQAVLHLRDQDVVAVSQEGKTLRPMIDDLAQIVGADIRCVPPKKQAVLHGLRGRNAVLLRGNGALCTGPSKDDAEAAAHLLVKGCRAHRFASVTKGCRPLSRADALLQRLIYTKQYAKKKQ